MKLRSTIFPEVLAATLLLVPATLSQGATLTLSLDTSFCSSTCQTPAGTITIMDLSGGGVSVDEELAPNIFANTGAGVSLAFDLSTTTGLVVSDLSSGFTALGAGSYGSNDLGTFNWAVDCTSCGNGTSAPRYSSLMFDLSGVTTASFLTNSKGLTAVSDIGVLQSNNSFNTGNIGATVTTGGGGGGGGPVTPEPGTIWLVFSGGVMVLLGCARRNKMRRV